MLQSKVLPFNAPEGVLFNVLVKSHVVLNNGAETVMFTAVPDTLSHDDILAGIWKGLQLSERALSVWHEIYTLKNGGEAVPIGYSNIRYLK